MFKKIYFVGLLLLLLLNCSCSQQKGNSNLSPRFNHVFLNVSSVEESIAFYQTAFGVQLYDEIRTLKRTDSLGNTTEAETYIALLRFPSQGFNLEIAANPNLEADNSNANYTHLGIDVMDIETASERLLKAGAIPVRPITLVEANDIKAKTAFFTGPNGETLELMQIIEGEF